MYKHYVCVPLWILSSTAGSLRSTAWTTDPSILFSFLSLIDHILSILSLHSKPPSPHSFHILLGRNSSLLKIGTEPSKMSVSTCKPIRHSIAWTTPKLEAWKCIVLRLMMRCAPLTYRILIGVGLKQIRPSGILTGKNRRCEYGGFGRHEKRRSSFMLTLYFPFVSFKTHCKEKNAFYSHKFSSINPYVPYTDWCRFNLLAPELFFLILTHPVYKMWIIQKTNTLELWNKLHF